MRRIKHLEQVDYIVTIGQRLNQLLTFSNHSNCYLQRTWDKINPTFEADLHAKFNADSFDGLSIEVRLLRNGELTSSVVDSISLYEVDNETFDKNFIAEFLPTLTGQSWVVSIPESGISPVEITGEKTFYVECVVKRQRKSYRISKYFNHIGIYDSFFRLKQEVDFLDITKLDE